MVIHFERKNKQGNDYMEDTTGKQSELNNSDIETYLIIMVSEDLSWEAQIDNDVKRANRILGILKNTFYSRDTSLRRNFYVSLVKPRLEYAIRASLP